MTGGGAAERRRGSMESFMEWPSGRRGCGLAQVPLIQCLFHATVEREQTQRAGPQFLIAGAVVELWWSWASRGRRSARPPQWCRRFEVRCDVGGAGGVAAGVVSYRGPDETNMGGSLMNSVW